MKFDIIRKKAEEIAFFLIQSPQPSLNYGLFNGSSGIALFLFYYYKYTGNQIYAEKAIDYLHYSIENVDSHFFHTFCTGISGTCLVINHLLSENLLELNNLDINKQFDLYLCRNARKHQINSIQKSFGFQNESKPDGKPIATILH